MRPEAEGPKRQRPLAQPGQWEADGVKDSDCSDSKYCTGVERCEGGACVAGTPPCPNSDTINCTSTCQEAEPHCGVAALDTDGDKHGTTLCANAPGDDCDDSQGTAYPGNTETCDGVDNDCDGKLDLAEGLPLGGTDLVLESGALSLGGLVWLPQQNYAALWVNATDKYVYVTQFSETGSKVEAAKPAGGYDPRLYSASRGYGAVAGGDHYGLLLAAQPLEASAPPVLSWRQIYPPSRIGPAYPLPAKLNTGSTPLMTREGQGVWDILWDEGNDVMLQRLAPADSFGTFASGGPIGAATALFPSASILAIGSTDGFVDALVAGKGGQISWDRMTGSINGNASRTNLQQLDATTSVALGGQLTSSPAATAAAWGTWETLGPDVFRAAVRFSSAGNPACSPSDIWRSDDIALRPVGATETPAGWVLSFMSGADAPGHRRVANPELMVTRVSKRCTVDLAQTVAQVGHNGVWQASAPNSVALAWLVNDTVRIRVFPTLLCK